MPFVLPQQGSIAGRIGKGFAKGLSEQVPKEIERYRLSKGLEEVGKKQGQTPFQQYASLAGVPGVTPQILEGGAKLLKQQGISNGLMNKANEGLRPNPNPFLKQEPITNANEKGKSPSLTTRTPLEATLKPYIPKDFNQLQQRAGQLLQQQPELYGQDPEKAMQAAIQEDAQEQSINTALQGQRANEESVQTRLKNGLDAQRQRLNALVPGNVYSDIEDKAINAVRSKSEGGEGLTEQEAQKKYGKELDTVSRDYEALETLGDWSVLTRTPNETKRALKSIREKFKDRNDLENLADTYISENGLSPSKAYYLAYPISENKELNNELIKIPEIKPEFNLKRGFPEKIVPQDISESKTLEIAPKLAKAMGTEGSPLAIAEELQSKGYDPSAWLNYLNKNRKKLNLGERQGRELDKPRNNFPTLADNWLFTFSGLDKLVEQ